MSTGLSFCGSDVSFTHPSGHSLQSSGGNFQTYYDDYIETFLTKQAHALPINIGANYHMQRTIK